MSDDKIKKALKNADSNVSIEDMINSKSDLKIIKQGLEDARSSKSFLFDLVKMVEDNQAKKEEDDKIARK